MAAPEENHHGDHPLFVALTASWAKEDRARYRPILIDAFDALGVLSRVDERAFKFREDKRREIMVGVEEPEALSELSKEVLSPIRALAQRLSLVNVSATPESEPSGTFDFDFNVYDGTGSAEKDKDSFNSQDIFGALDALEPAREESATERRRNIDREIESFAFGLNRQLSLYDDRLAQTMNDGEMTRALQELEDAVETFVEGVFALVIAISRPFLASFDRAKLMPGHRTSLENALVVRAGLADVRREITEHNTRLQDTARTQEARTEALGALVSKLRRFVASETFAAMRAAERHQMTLFLSALEGLSVGTALQEAEGLAKYLDSLAMVSTRDSIAQHDRETMKSAADLLEAAHSIVGVSVVNAQNLTRDALGLIARLYGMQDNLDELLLVWRAAPPSLESADEITALIDRLYMVEPRLNAVHWFSEVASSA
ncbi:MAG: hypothetical protein IPK13_08310 [Deltaproteobacteria bacterium]|nr:hypothetical protein [Deltaproteobacteria bacterium]